MARAAHTGRIQQTGISGTDRYTRQGYDRSTNTGYEATTISEVVPSSSDTTRPMGHRTQCHEHTYFLPDRLKGDVELQTS